MKIMKKFLTDKEDYEAVLLYKSLNPVYINEGGEIFIEKSGISVKMGETSVKMGIVIFHRGQSL